MSTYKARELQNTLCIPNLRGFDVHEPGGLILCREVAVSYIANARPDNFPFRRLRTHEMVAEWCPGGDGYLVLALVDELINKVYTQKTSPF